MEPGIQASSFDLPTLKGKSIDQFLAYGDSNSSEDVDLVVIKVVESDSWYRFFLDAGIGFFSSCLSKESVIEGFEECFELDYAKEVGARGGILSAVRCVGSEPDQPGLSRFEFLTDRFEISLSYADALDLSSNTHLEYRDLT